MAVASDIGYQRLRIGAHGAEEPETLLQLERNDTRVAGLFVRFSDMADHPDVADDWAKRVGSAIGNSAHLRNLGIAAESEDQLPPYGLPSLFMGIAANRSIEQFSLSDFNHAHLNIFTILAPFFEHNKNLRSLEITMSKMPRKMNVPSFVTSLALTSKLEHIDISENNLGDTGAADLIYVLTKLPGLHHLVELNLGGNGIKKKSCTALRKLLRNPSTKIQVLYLFNNYIDDACIDILFGGLVDNKSIKFINLQKQKLATATGWGVFFDVFSNSDCSLDRVLFCNNDIGDAGAISLGESIAVNNKVFMLHLRFCTSITSVGWQGFSKGLKSPNCPIIALDLSGCDVTDDGAVAIASGLAENTKLEYLHMENIKCITSAGWRDFCFQLSSCVSPSLKRLSLSDNNIDDIGAAFLVGALVKMSKLVCFSLSGMTSISAIGWRVFEDILKPSSASKLQDLYLGSQLGEDFRPIAIDSDAVVPFANALAGNTRLTTFAFHGVKFSERSWIALADALCNTSSIDSTYWSNHTLSQFNCYENKPSYLAPLLAMNYKGDKAAVARKKILSHHFDDFDAVLDVFGPMEAPVLPTALSWIGRDRCEYAMMVRLLHSMPWLVESATNPKLSM